MPALIAPVFPELAGNFSSMSPRGFEASSLLKNSKSDVRCAIFESKA
jgi:hypothetical protein